MPDYQPIDYRLRCHTKRADLPADVLRDIGEAYETIHRLTRERDDARREVCKTFAIHTPRHLPGSNPMLHSTIRGWNCFEEKTND